MKLNVTYLKWRDGHPRWEPGPQLRAKGWKGRDLKAAETGEWLGMQDAIDAAQKLNAEVAAWRAAGKKSLRPSALQTKSMAAVPVTTCARLYDEWIKSPHFSKLGEKTQRDYKNKARPFLAEFGDISVTAVEKHHLYQWWEELFQGRGHHMANGIIAVVRTMFSYADQKGWRKTINPAFNLKLEGVAPRLVMWLDKELLHFVATADAMQLHSVGDAVVVAVSSGQRQADVLGLKAAVTTAERLKLQQGKRKARIDAPMLPQLHARLADIARRLRDRAVVSLEAPLITREDTGEKYDAYSFNKAFRTVREAAAKTMPDIANRKFLDLRDTAVTRLALAGCDLPEISAITGHSLQSITQIMKHYLVMQPEMADSAIRKLREWCEAKGIAL